MDERSSERPERYATGVDARGGGAGPDTAASLSGPPYAAFAVAACRRRGIRRATTPDSSRVWPTRARPVTAAAAAKVIQRCVEPEKIPTVTRIDHAPSTVVARPMPRSTLPRPSATVPAPRTVIAIERAKSIALAVE